MNENANTEIHITVNNKTFVKKFKKFNYAIKVCDPLPYPASKLYITPSDIRTISGNSIRACLAYEIKWIKWTVIIFMLF